METERIVELILQELRGLQAPAPTASKRIPAHDAPCPAPNPPAPTPSIAAEAPCWADAENTAEGYVPTDPRPACSRPAPAGLPLDARPCPDFVRPDKLGATRENPTEMLKRMRAATSARIGIGKCGARMRTDTVLRFRADHAAAKDAVAKDVPEELLQRLGLFTVQTLCTDHDEYLTRPDLGRNFSKETLAELEKKCKPHPDVQIYAAGGLSSTAIGANLANCLPAIIDGLTAKGLSVGTPFYVRYARVPSMDPISELLRPKVTCVLIGERPGLATAESMSAYIAYEATVGMPESRRTVVSNIHKGGISAVEAGAYIADLIARMIEKKASGVDFVR